METIDLTQPEKSHHLGQTLNEEVSGTRNYRKEKSVLDHVEVLRCFQQKNYHWKISGN